MDRESHELIGQAGENALPARVTIESLYANPDIYKNQLLVVLYGLPEDQTVTYDLQGEQAEQVVNFCLNMNHLDFINTEVTKVFEEPSQLTEESQKLVAALNESGITENERRLRKRLVAWVEHLAERTKHENPSNGNHQAA